MAARDRSKVAPRAEKRAPTAEKRRLDEISRALEAMIGGDLERKLPISEAGDELDAICYRVNILVGELGFATANVRRAQADAEAANAAKSKFLRTASHELRTPLAVIVWLTELLKEPDRVPPERFARSLVGIRRSAEELLRTTEAVLDLSRLDRPDEEEVCEVVDVAETVREALENLQPLAERKQLGLRLVISPGVPATLRSNGQHVRQVIVNLVANAIKFTAQGEVVVRVQRQEPLLAIDVEDSGIGIPPGARARIFDPFFQVDRAASKKLGGSGVGLAIAKRFAEKLGGDLTLTRTEEGGGSTFRFTLPLDTASGVVEIAVDPADVTPILPLRARPLEALRVLVVDDEEVMQDALCKLLETEGAIVSRASDGAQAMEKALTQDFGLILMDIRMPVVDGLGATSRLRAAGFWRPIIALTASATPDQRAACLAAGCNDHLTKPIAAGDLISKIASVCRRLS